MRAPLLAAAAVTAALAGCASNPTMYHWGGYDSALYDHYHEPANREAWVASLRASILEAEQQGRRMPPGLYAEYGYALLEEGNTRDATAYFQKEKALWPESAVLMDKMIRNAGQRPARAASGPGAATRLETAP